MGFWKDILSGNVLGGLSDLAERAEKRREDATHRQATSESEARNNSRPFFTVRKSESPFGDTAYLTYERTGDDSETPLTDITVTVTFVHEHINFPIPTRGADRSVEKEFSYDNWKPGEVKTINWKGTGGRLLKLKLNGRYKFRGSGKQLDPTFHFSGFFGGTGTQA